MSRPRIQFVNLYDTVSTRNDVLGEKVITNIQV